MKPGNCFSSLTLGSILFIAVGCNKSDGLPPPVSDVDGNSYKTVQIGEQVWMAENLKSTRFSDGEIISNVSDQNSWSTIDTPALCWYNNNEDSVKAVYGALYNFYSVASGKLCPAGWHVPSSDDLKKLRDFLGDSLICGGSLKEEGTTHWKSPNTGADNSSGFTALPAGIRYFEGSFNSISFFTSFWSSSEYDENKAWYFSLYYSDSLFKMDRTSNKDGFSVRCVKN